MSFAEAFMERMAKRLLLADIVARGVATRSTFPDDAKVAMAGRAPDNCPPVNSMRGPATFITGAAEFHTNSADLQALTRRTHRGHSRVSSGAGREPVVEPLCINTGSCSTVQAPPDAPRQPR